MRAVFCCFLLLVSFQLSIAQTPKEDVEIGMKLRAEGKLPEAFNHFLAAAEHGSPEGMYATAMMYSMGEGVDTNMEEANKWWRKSAYKGFLKSYSHLGKYFLQQKQIDSAIFYLEQVVEHEPELNGILGKIYYEREDLKAAAAYFKVGRDAEDPMSMYYLGMMYYDGDYLKPNEREAVKMFQQAAKRGYQPAQEYLEDLGYDDLEEIDAPKVKKEKKKKNKKKQKEDAEEQDEMEEEVPLTKKEKRLQKQKEKEEEQEFEEEPISKKEKLKKSKDEKDDEASEETQKKEDEE